MAARAWCGSWRMVQGCQGGHAAFSEGAAGAAEDGRRGASHRRSHQPWTARRHSRGSRAAPQDRGCSAVRSFVPRAWYWLPQGRHRPKVHGDGGRRWRCGPVRPQRGGSELDGVESSSATSCIHLGARPSRPRDVADARLRPCRLELGAAARMEVHLDGSSRGAQRRCVRRGGGVCARLSGASPPS